MKKYLTIIIKEFTIITINHLYSVKYLCKVLTFTEMIDEK